MHADPSNQSFIASEPVVDIDALREQQRQLGHSGRLSWFHWTIVGLSFAITLYAWHISRSLSDDNIQHRFDQESTRIIDLMRERLMHYEDALNSGVATMQATGGNLSRKQWQRYTEYLDLPNRYPGISGIGVIHYVEADGLEQFEQETRRHSPGFRVHPEHEFDFHLPITFIEDEQKNLAAVGLDVAFEKNRRNAALLARSTGTKQISGPIVLVQDAGETPGFLFYAPYYTHGTRAPPGVSQAEHREQTFQGLVYAPLVVRDLVAGTLGNAYRSVMLSISDRDTVLYEETASDTATTATLTKRADVDWYGRTWSFDITSTPAFTAEAGVHQSTLVLAGGLAADSLLMLLFLLMARSNRRMLKLAKGMTDNLSNKSIALAATNRDLESFAHVVSHDLKTPIRGIENLAEFLEEDLIDYLASNDANPEVRNSLDRLHAQATKSQTLIDGILQYSIVGTAEETQSPVDFRSLIISIGTTLQLQPGRLQVEGDLPRFTTRSVRLEQVFSNLIGNAIKYHHEPKQAVITVAASEQQGCCYFSVRDNGPGIAFRYHERIFRPFTTLQTHQDIHSSGIGLSIVKRSIESQGGQISVESEVGRGTCFHFSWPLADDAMTKRKSA